MSWQRLDTTGRHLGMPEPLASPPDGMRFKVVYTTIAKVEVIFDGLARKTQLGLTHCSKNGFTF
jgi:hypothetical protein